jgi:Catalytic LigB subunit of aromatic ring-opening dioxygenase
MAQIALGIGTSHGPQLSTPPQEWGQRASADRRNPALAFRGADYSFEELSELRGAAFAAECELDVQRERHTRSRAAIEELGRIIRAADIDVLVIVSSDHKEIYGDELLPQFAIYWGETMRHEPYTAEQLATLPPGLAIAEVANQPEQPEIRQGHAELGLHLIHEVSRAGFDPAAAKLLPAGRWENHSIPHGWGFILQQVLGGHDLIPIVPVFVNTFWQPNPPSASRCYDFGVALGEAIKSFPADLRVGVVASGGLSHFVIDEELDTGLMRALIEKDKEFMTGLTDDELRSGTSEIRNWVVVGGATADTKLSAQIIDYLPCYRSEAGTGCAMAFMAWQP